MERKEKARTSSIARRINLEFVVEQFAAYLGMDVGIAALAVVCWCIATEIGQFGEFVWNRGMRWFEFGDNGVILYYVVQSGNGRSFYFDGTMFVKMFLSCLVIVGAVQIISLLSGLIFGTRRVRDQLYPLNELAKKAEKLSSVAFDESKFQQLEDAISNVDLESGEEHLHIGDKDLQGLELAVNNLIDRMRESYRQQSRFVSDASHELRTPISVVQGYANMLDRWGKEDEKVLDESITAIRHESEHMSTLVEQLLFLARSDSGRQKMERAEFSLSGLLEEVYEESRMIDSDHSYSLRRQDSYDVKMTGDSTMVKQVIRILADNARKYTRERDEIIFAVGTERGVPFFYVQDTGIGMLEKDMSHIFERFYRSDEARNGSVDGSGLGLSIAKWIVDKHRGHFEILSREGLGTRITVWFHG